ncbi:hypothetical protein BST43_26000 [Mycobacteroides saopaulense]|uniref:Uncharacterized protein n=1 Tax=Mycobacteroides saopaulense TaxID=1578165 RepID=A0A1X0IJN0_9MYCO|nr:hypothetical protein [Mycobacteroides saopaulense]ORB47475.1 hypothetical protein BST43_26000 [Mycobacteroides saopaulense]
MAYVHEPYWLGHDGDYLKTLLLFFDGIAVTVPDYMKDAPLSADPVLAQPLSEHGLLEQLSPESLVDESATETLVEALVELITAGAFKNLDTNAAFVELSGSRLGTYGHRGLAKFLLAELEERGLAKPSEDGVSVPLHPEVRAFVLITLPQILRKSAESIGLALHPISGRPRQVQALLNLLNVDTLPSVGHIVAADLEQVTLDLATVPLDEVLDFRDAHGEAYRTYARNLRRFVRDLGPLDDADREAALLDRRDELADAADDLRRQARKAWRRPLASFSLGIAGSAVTLAGGNVPGAMIGAAAAIVGLGRRSEPGSAYSYLFQAQAKLATARGSR